MTPYEKLVSEVGVDAAKREMQRRRGMVKNLGRGGFASNKELAKRASKLGVAAREEKRQSTQEAS